MMGSQFKKTIENTDEGVTVGILKKSEVVSSFMNDNGNPKVEKSRVNGQSSTGVGFTEEEEHLGEWKTVTRRKFNDKPFNRIHSSNRVFSVFITNIPEDIPAQQLKVAVERFGKCVDTIIPRNQKNGRKRFGFSRFININDSEKLCRNISKIKLKDKVLQAYPAKPKPQVKELKKDVNSVFSRIYFPKSGNHTSGNNVSYRDALTKNMQEKLISAEVKKKKDEDANILCSLRAVAKSLKVLQDLHNLQVWEEFKGVRLIYLGGLQVQLLFQSEILKTAFLLGWKDSWSEVFEDLTHFHVKKLLSKRLAWIHLRSVAFSCWDYKAMHVVLRNYGRVLKSPSELEFQINKAGAEFVVLTDRIQHISEKVWFYSSEGDFPAWVEEFNDTWLPKFASNLNWVLDSQGDDDVVYEVGRVTEDPSAEDIYKSCKEDDLHSSETSNRHKLSTVKTQVDIPSMTIQNAPNDTIPATQATNAGVVVGGLDDSCPLSRKTNEVSATSDRGQLGSLQTKNNNAEVSVSPTKSNANSNSDMDMESTPCNGVMWLSPDKRIPAQIGNPIIFQGIKIKKPKFANQALNAKVGGPMTRSKSKRAGHFTKDQSVLEEDNSRVQFSHPIPDMDDEADLVACSEDDDWVEDTQSDISPSLSGGLKDLADDFNLIQETADFLQVDFQGKGKEIKDYLQTSRTTTVNR